MFNKKDFDGHECVIHSYDRESGLKAIIAIHNTILGPAFGGCRMWPYTDDDAALTDALRLSRGMTYKAAICDLPYGGGKSVIIADSRKQKTPELLRAMGRLVERLNGRYIIADDVGTTLEDLLVMREETGHTAGATEAAQKPLAVTAYGVQMGIEAAIEHRFGQSDCNGLRVAVQGLGNVGMPLSRSLKKLGAELLVSDINPENTRLAKQELGAEVVDIEEIYSQDVDVFAPCALGAVINDDTIPRLKAKVICGGANNQLQSQHHDESLAARGILFVPDYLANAGGVIDFYQESIDDSAQAIMDSVARIRSITTQVLNRSASSGRTPLQVADSMVEERLYA